MRNRGGGKLSHGGFLTLNEEAASTKAIAKNWPFGTEKPKPFQTPSEKPQYIIFFSFILLSKKISHV